MAAGGRNPQKSAMARAKAQAKDAQKSKGGGGKEAEAQRRGANMDEKMSATAARKAQVAANKAKKEEEKVREAEREQRRKEKEERDAKKAAKDAAAKGGGAAAGGGDAAKIATLQKKWMPVVKEGEKLEEAGDLEGALAKYQDAMTGFRSEGIKRPKLKEKMDACRAKIDEEAEC